MNEKNVEMMKKILEEKKQKGTNGPDNSSNCQMGKRKPKKGGIF